MNLDPQTLYIRDNKGAVREWSISVEDGIIVIEHGLVNGAKQVATEEVYEGKAGRSLEDQILLRVDSRVNRRKDMGYTDSIESATRPPVNKLGLPKPMLAQPLKNVRNIDFSLAYYQHKFDGNRMLIACTNGVKVAYTRNGKIYNTVDHILDDIEIEEGMILDGELYCHGESLQTIVSWAKRDEPTQDSLRLKYHVYDLVWPVPFRERLAMLKYINYGPNANLVTTKAVHTMDEVMELFHHSRNTGYEGGILRWGESGYEDGKRSKSLIKIKKFLDGEFIVTGVNPSKDWWGILSCETSNGIQFSVSAPGSLIEKREVLMNKEKYIGKFVRIEYANMTKDGVPFHPNAIGWRSREDD